MSKEFWEKVRFFAPLIIKPGTLDIKNLRKKDRRGEVSIDEDGVGHVEDTKALLRLSDSSGYQLEDFSRLRKFGGGAVVRTVSKNGKIGHHEIPLNRLNPKMEIKDAKDEVAATIVFSEEMLKDFLNKSS